MLRCYRTVCLQGKRAVAISEIEPKKSIRTIDNPLKGITSDIYNQLTKFIRWLNISEGVRVKGLPFDTLFDLIL